MRGSREPVFDTYFRYAATLVALVRCTPLASGADRMDATGSPPGDSSTNTEASIPDAVGADARGAEAGGPDASISDAAGGDAGPTDAARAAPCFDAADTADFYVNPAATGCAFATIGAAIAAAAKSTAATKKIHVAAGTYSAATGESFPIELRGGTWLVGAGQNSSVVIGTGPVSQAAQPRNVVGPFSSSLSAHATLLVGDSTESTVVTGFSLLPGTSATAGTEAIHCDRGNAPSRVSDGGSYPTPNVTIGNVAIDGFEISIRVTWSSSPVSGCNALITGSDLASGRYGVVADGESDENGNPQQFVSVALGDGTPDGGNNLRNFAVDDPSSPVWLAGAGFAIADAVLPAPVLGNHFFQDSTGTGQVGIYLQQQVPVANPSFDVENNDFGPLWNTGIQNGGGVIGELKGNVFHEISMPPTIDAFLASALSSGWDGIAYTAVIHARNNTFFGNDIGVRIGGIRPGFQDEGALRDDFGTATDPGLNTFRCNGSTPSQQQAQIGPGGDVFIFSASVPPYPIIPFIGNTWDHAPASVFENHHVDGPNGMDVCLTGSTGADGGYVGATVDTSYPSATQTPACPDGRLPGP
jgi:hypothetical protein